jgi:hypothetical protein
MRLRIRLNSIVGPDDIMLVDSRNFCRAQWHYARSLLLLAISIYMVVSNHKDTSRLRGGAFPVFSARCRERIQLVHL